MSSKAEAYGVESLFLLIDRVEYFCQQNWPWLKAEQIEPVFGGRRPLLTLQVNVSNYWQSAHVAKLVAPSQAGGFTVTLVESLLQLRTIVGIYQKTGAALVLGLLPWFSFYHHVLILEDGVGGTLAGGRILLR